MQSPSFFVANSEDLILDETSRSRLRGDYISLSRGVTHYELRGPETGPLVFLAGSLTVPLFYWDRVVDRLHRHGLRTLTYSAYGRGYSDRVIGPYDRDLFVDQAQEILDAVGQPGPWHIVGSSMGALVSLALLPRIVNRVQTLSLIGPAGFTDGNPLPARLATRPRLGPFLGRRFGHKVLEGHLSHNVRTPEQVAAITEMVTETYRCRGSMYALLSTLKEFPLHRQQDLYAQTPRLGVPTFLLWGEEDRVTPIGKFQEVISLLLPVRQEIVTECGHMVPFERPVQTADSLQRFIGDMA